MTSAGEPIPSAAWSFLEVELLVTALAHAGEALVEYRLTNRSGFPQEGALVLTVRPVQINPYWQHGGQAAINAIANPHVPEIGERFLGTVVKLATFGAFVSLIPGKDGLLHISELKKMAGKRVENVEDVLEVGQKLQVEITKIDDRGKLSLSPVVEGDGSASSDEE